MGPKPASYIEANPYTVDVHAAGSGCICHRLLKARTINAFTDANLKISPVFDFEWVKPKQNHGKARMRITITLQSYVYHALLRGLK